MTKTVVLSLAVCAIAGTAAAQEFRPPDPAVRRPEEQRSEAPERSGVRAGILAFSTRAGGQVNQDGQAVLGSTVDMLQLWTPRVRLRPSAEVGFGRPEKSIGANLEVMLRFLPDSAPAVPYLGLGVGYYDDGTSDYVWPTFALGFEMPLRGTIRWLVEYHALDGLRRSRFLVGLGAGTGGP